MADVDTLEARHLVTDHPVRVTLPLKAAYDFDVFVQVQRDIFERLGHSMCVSGFDIRWGLEDDFLVDDQLRIVAR